MILVLTYRRDIDLSAVYRVARHKEAVRLSDKPPARIEFCRKSFLQLINSDPDIMKRLYFGGFKAVL